MKTKFVFSLILSTLAIYCDPSIRKTEYSNDGNILIGHWRHYDMSGADQGTVGPRSDLILNKNSTYSISIEPSDYIDNGAFTTNGDTLFLISSDNYTWNREFIFEFDFKYQYMKLSALNKRQESAWTHLFREWHKINRFGRGIDLDGVY